MNYRVCVGILLRKPFFGEFLISNNKRILTIWLLKKLYFLY